MEKDPLYNLSEEKPPIDEDAVLALINGQLRNFQSPAVVGQGFLQSGNFVSGTAGWKLSPSGAEIYSLTANVSQVVKKYTALVNINEGDTLYISSDLSFNNFTESDVNSATNSFAHLVGGGNNVFAVATIYLQSGATITGNVTLNGVNMSLGRLQQNGNEGVSIYYLALGVTTSGNQTFSATQTGVNAFNVRIATYFNVRQTGQPDASAGVNNLTQSITVATAGSWLISMGRSTSATITSSTNNTTRGSASTTAFGDSNGPVSAGVKTVAYAGGGGTQVMVTIAMAPAITGSELFCNKASASIASSSDSFIGFALGTVTALETGYVVISGEATGLTGLTVANRYYLSDTAGQISTVAGTVTRKVGIAISPVSLLITNIW